MPQTPPPQQWMDEAIRLIRLRQPVRCWRCAVTVEAQLILNPGRCTAPHVKASDDVCPLNAAARDVLADKIAAEDAREARLANGQFGVGA